MVGGGVSCRRWRGWLPSLRQRREDKHAVHGVSNVFLASLIFALFVSMRSRYVVMVGHIWRY